MADSKKFELVDPKTVYGRQLFRIKALKDFGDIMKGDIGGYVEKEENLSQEGDCWIGFEASVMDNCRVAEDAYVGGLVRLKGASAGAGGTIQGDTTLLGNFSIYSNEREMESVLSGYKTEGLKEIKKHRDVVRDLQKAEAEIEAAKLEKEEAKAKKLQASAERKEELEKRKQERSRKAEERKAKRELEASEKSERAKERKLKKEAKIKEENKKLEVKKSLEPKKMSESDEDFDFDSDFLD